MRIVFLFLAVLGCPMKALVQTNTNAPVAASRMSLWNCKFSDGNYYSVSLGAIDSVSQHEYLLDGALRVVEVTVATRGSTQARFYVLEKPSTDTGGLPGQSLADGMGRVTEEIVSRAPGSVKSVTNSVVKKSRSRDCPGSITNSPPLLSAKIRKVGTGSVSSSIRAMN